MFGWQVTYLDIYLFYVYGSDCAARPVARRVCGLLRHRCHYVARGVRLCVCLRALCCAKAPEPSDSRFASRIQVGTKEGSSTVLEAGAEPLTGRVTFMIKVSVFPKR